jgi:hypothetical protein
VTLVAECHRNSHGRNKFQGLFMNIVVVVVMYYGNERCVVVTVIVVIDQ